MVDVVVDEECEPRRSRRRDRRKRLVDAEDEREKEGGVGETEPDRTEEGRPHLLTGGSETDNRTGVCVHQAEADRQDQEQAQGLRDVERVARKPGGDHDAARGDSDPERDSVERGVEAALVGTTVQVHELERFFQDDRGDEDPKGFVTGQGQGEDAGHGAEHEAGRQAAEDAAVVRLSRAFGLDRERALKLFEAGFGHPKQLRDRDPNRVLEKGEVGILFICTNCGGFVAGGDTTCPRCAAEFEADAEEAPVEEEDILDLVLCPVCGADNDSDLVECEICGESLRERTTKPVVAAAQAPAPASKVPGPEGTLAKVDDFLREPEKSSPEATVKPIPRERPATTPPGPSRMPSSPSPVRREAPDTNPPVAVKSNAPSAPGATSVSPNVPPSAALRRVPSTRPKPRLVESDARPAPPQPNAGLDVRMEPRKVTVTPRQATRPPSPSISKKRGPVVRKPLRPVTRAVPGLSPETLGALVLAGAASLVVAAVLNQHLVSLGIAVVLLGIGAFQSAGLLRSRMARPNHRETGLLAGGALIGLAATILREGPVILATALAVGAALPFGAATSWMLRKPYRALLAITSVVPIAAQAVVHGMDPAFRPTLLWILGLAASMPWAS